MAEQQDEKEPTMEEILASIRRIISEDEEGEGAAENGAAPDLETVTPSDDAGGDALAEDAAADADASAMEAPAEADGDDILELTDEVTEDESADETGDAEDDLVMIDADDDVAAMDAADDAEAAFDETPAMDDDVVAEPAELTADAAATADATPSETLVSPPVADATAGAFGSLISNLLVSRGGEGKTLEDLVAELMRPMLKDWLDANLRDIVEARVADEVEKIASRARR